MCGYSGNNISKCRYKAFLKGTDCKGKAASLKKCEKNFTVLPSLLVKRQLQSILSMQTVLPECGEGRTNPLQLVTGILAILTTTSGLQPKRFPGSSILAESLSSLNSTSDMSSCSHSFGWRQGAVGGCLEWQQWCWWRVTNRCEKFFVRVIFSAVILWHHRTANSVWPYN